MSRFAVAMTALVFLALALGFFAGAGVAYRDAALELRDATSGVIR